nr:replication factor C subunit 4 [Kwoniella shandongensis]KAA5524745.1 replication factor C subunit 4 [Kwoniella shandongensis]
MAAFAPRPAAGAMTTDPRLQPWVEKYRPKTIDDVSSQEHTVAVLRKSLLSTNLPHMLFYGPPGTGKTIAKAQSSLLLDNSSASSLTFLHSLSPSSFAFTIRQTCHLPHLPISPRLRPLHTPSTGLVVHAILPSSPPCLPIVAAPLFTPTSCCTHHHTSPDLFKSRVLELNASDERGISVVREKIKTFARETPRHGAGGVSSDGKTYPCPPYKLIILDEADSMTQDAQSALRRIMETYSRITRFCLVCNYVTRIIEPLASRCSKFRFRPLAQGSTQARIEMIAKAEGVDAEDGVLPLILELAGGDLRKAITYLQTAQRLHSATEPPTPISSISIHEISGVVPDDLITHLLSVMGVDRESGVDLSLSSGFEGVRTAVKRVGREGWSAGQVLEQIHDALIPLPTIPAIQKSIAAMAIAECDKGLCEGGDEELQLLECCLRVKEAMERQ